MWTGSFPALYPILDSSYLAGAADRAGLLRRIIGELADAGIRILQYRNKSGEEAEILADAGVLRAATDGTGLLLILNDFPQLAVEANFDGCHVGQTDMSPSEARCILGLGKILGVSTHNEGQLRAAHLEPADYLAIGPVYPTATKDDPDPVVGLEGVRQASHLTQKPLVAIGGITAANVREVLDAGADSVAVISAVFAAGSSPGQRARAFAAGL